MSAALRALCRECLREHRVPGQWRCTSCHAAWIARQQPQDKKP